ncbi:hypothetical protein FOA52_003566 [Chlamydomonas sp. UWO 241]|nr:hypothetical protein FOA52_003566 [Chlamydomonas sp. UWO 241]
MSVVQPGGGSLAFALASWDSKLLCAKVAKRASLEQAHEPVTPAATQPVLRRSSDNTLARSEHQSCTERHHAAAAAVLRASAIHAMVARAPTATPQPQATVQQRRAAPRALGPGVYVCRARVSAEQHAHHHSHTTHGRVALTGAVMQKLGPSGGGVIKPVSRQMTGASGAPGWGGGGGSSSCWHMPPPHPVQPSAAAAAAHMAPPLLANRRPPTVLLSTKPPPHALVHATGRLLPQITAGMAATARHQGALLTQHAAALAQLLEMQAQARRVQQQLHAAVAAAAAAATATPLGYHHAPGPRPWSGTDEPHDARMHHAVASSCVPVQGQRSSHCGAQQPSVLAAADSAALQSLAAAAGECAMGDADTEAAAQALLMMMAPNAPAAAPCAALRAKH